VSIGAHAPDRGGEEAVTVAGAPRFIGCQVARCSVTPGRMRAPILLAALILSPAAVRAEPPVETVTATYTVYAAGLTTAEVQATLALSPDGYELRLGFHTVGLYGAFVHSESDTLAQGVWRGDAAAPFHFAGSGRVQGELRQTVIDYRGGDPQIRTLIPPNEAERAPVPPAMERNTVDTLSPMALLVKRVRDTGRCDAHAITFDGRRLVDVTAYTAGTQIVARSDRSPFAGPALRCDFDGRQLAGFRRGEDVAELSRPKRGAAWFAPVVPGGPPIPIRLEFPTRWFGVATLYLTSAAATGAPLMAKVAR
jgi:hypothetical protein